MVLAGFRRTPHSPALSKPGCSAAEECGDIEFVAPLTAFMSAQVWELCRPFLLTEFPTLQVENMLPNGTRLAIEVL